MVENKWIVDGHHYTCPDCKKTIAIVVNESDEGFEFCPFCGKRMSSQMAENKMEQVAAMFGKKLNQRFVARSMFDEHRKCIFTDEGLETEDIHGKVYIDNMWFLYLLTGKAYEVK